MNMLRTRRRDNNVKPNRRLDRKSSRGMIYENEELRLKTININAEIERGQSDIKKLRRENEMLKKEIWYLRDEYEKLDKLLKQKEVDFSSSSSTCSSDSEASLSEDPKEVETSQNIENVQKTNLKNLQTEFDHLSVVPEEPSTENSDKSPTSALDLQEIGLGLDENETTGILQPDQGYPGFPMTKHFFSPIPLPQRPLTPPQVQHFYTFRNEVLPLPASLTTLETPGPSGSNSTSPKPVDLIVKTDNRGFTSSGMTHLGSLNKLDPMQMLEVEHFESQCGGGSGCGYPDGSFPRSSFSNGGNLEELLNDIQTISEDILKISNPNPNVEHFSNGHYPLEKSSFNGNIQSLDRLLEPEVGEVNGYVSNRDKDLDKYKSEINVVLMPTPMPLIGFEKYQNLSSDKINFGSLQMQDLSNSSDQLTDLDNTGVNIHTKVNGLSGIPGIPSLESIHSEGIEGKDTPSDLDDKKGEKMSIRRKVSIHFKGRKDKDKDKLKEEKKKEEDSTGTKKLRPPGSSTNIFSNDEHVQKDLLSIPVPQSIPTPLPSETPCISSTPIPPTTSSLQNNTKDSSDSEHPASSSKPQNKSTSASPERHDGLKKHHKHKKKKKPSAGGGLGGYLKTRRNTLSTDQMHRERSLSICTDRGPYMTDDYLPSSERERTNSLSSCGTNAERNRRKFSTISRIPSGTGGKIPWCACWGNGCI